MLFWLVSNNFVMWDILFISCFLVGIESKLFFKEDVSSSNTAIILGSSRISFWDIYDTTFHKAFPTVTVVSDCNDFLDPKDLSTQFFLTEWHSSTNTISESNAAIIVVKTPTELNNLFERKSSLTSQQYIFVIIILECSESIKSEMSSLWSMYYIYKYVVICGVTKPVLYIYRPFLPGNNSKITEITDTFEIVDNILHATDNLYGSVMNIVLFPLMPYTIMSKGKYIGGVDLIVLNTLQERMNFSPVLFQPTDGKTYSVIGHNVSGSMRDVVLGHADIAFNGHFLMDYNNDDITLTRSMAMDKVCFIVPMPSYRTHYAVVVHIFSTYVWCMIFVMYFSVVILYYMIEKITNVNRQRYSVQDLLLQSFTLTTLGTTTIRADMTSKKLLIGSILMTVLIINNTFQGSLVTVLSRPMRNPYIDTMEDLAESNLVLQSRRAESLLTDREGAHLVTTLRQRKSSEDKNFVRLGRFPITIVRVYRNYLYYRKNVTEHLHAVPECIATYSLAYVVPRNSPYLSRINKLLLQLFESGLHVNWFGAKLMFLMRNICLPLENESFTQTKAKTFSLADLGFAFVFLLFGLAFSSVVFFIELLLGNKKANVKNKRSVKEFNPFVL